MIVPSLGIWSYSAGRWFVRNRIYLKGYIWTPFAHIRRRISIDGPSTPCPPPK